MNNNVSTYFKDYREFVKSVLSDESSDLETMIARLRELEKQSANPALLLTASVGLGAEAGEFTEVVKKIVYQGKPFNEDNRFHMKRELSDVCFYLMCACIALDYDFDAVVDENIKKLQARYPNGFEVNRSEVRKENDL